MNGFAAQVQDQLFDQILICCAWCLGSTNVQSVQTLSHLSQKAGAESIREACLSCWHGVGHLFSDNMPEPHHQPNPEPEHIGSGDIIQNCYPILLHMSWIG